MLAALQHILASIGFHDDVGTFIVLFGLIVTRLVTAITLTPFMGGKTVSPQVKVGLAALISILVFPTLAPHLNAGELSSLRVLCLLIKEAVIGSTIGFLSQIIFQSVQMAGATMDYSRGMSQATFFAPQLENNVSLLGQLQLQASLVLFLVLNGHLLFLRALAGSFQKMPLLDFPQFSGGTMAAMEQMARYYGREPFDCGTTQCTGTPGSFSCRREFRSHRKGCLGPECASGKPAGEGDVRFGSVSSRAVVSGESYARLFCGND